MSVDLVCLLHFQFLFVRFAAWRPAISTVPFQDLQYGLEWITRDCPAAGVLRARWVVAVLHCYRHCHAIEDLRLHWSSCIVLAYERVLGLVLDWRKTAQVDRSRPDRAEWNFTIGSTFFPTKQHVVSYNVSTCRPKPFSGQRSPECVGICNSFVKLMEERVAHGRMRKWACGGLATKNESK